MQMLNTSGLLENSWVVVLSDHGTALGLVGDRVISEANYQGDKKKMKIVPVTKLSSLPPVNVHNKPVYSVNTSYGQGTNILSLVQNHVLLAFRRYGGNFHKHEINEFASLLDVAPTLLDVLNIPPLTQVDGISLSDYFSGDDNKKSSSRPFFMETGDSMSTIETDHIYIEKVIKHQIGIYGINPTNGLLTMNPLATHSIIRANNWLL